MTSPLRPESLPEPDITAPQRILARLERAQRRRARRPLVLVGALAAFGLTAVVGSQVIRQQDTPRELTVTSPAVAATSWSPTVDLTTNGTGALHGTDEDLTVDWHSGTLQAEVVPNSGTRVAVQTDEALVEVVGTVFSVTRDLLGTTVAVQRGAVRVTCQGNAPEMVTADNHSTCLPTTATGLLGRAEALLEAGSSSADLMVTLDRGVQLAVDDAVKGELLVRRMQQSAEQGLTDAALRDAESYVSLTEKPRETQVLRFAGWLALEERGCDAAQRWLQPLHAAGSGPETVLLAECIATSDPARARQHLETALPALDDVWSDRAMRLLGQLNGR